MEAKAVVAAFSDSPTLRETLAVLLERECHLEFLSPNTTAPMAALSPDVAVVATRAPNPLLRDLTRQWPRLPIVAIDSRQVGDRDQTPLSSPSPTVHTVALEPLAIRAAVIGRLPVHPVGNLLRAIVGTVGETLHADLRYPFTMLRSFPALCVRSDGANTDAVLAAILREQVAVITEHIEHLERFRTRPRRVPLSEDFVTALCRHLEQPDILSTQRGLLCTCSLDTAAPPAAGPTALAPLVAMLVRTHLRRRSETSVIAVHATAHRIDMRYTLRAETAAKSTSWPLLLADLALESGSWRIATSASNGYETLTLSGVT